MTQKDIEILIIAYCEDNNIDARGGFPNRKKHDLMKHLSDHKKIEDRKLRRRKKFDDSRIENIIETIVSRI